MNIRNSITRFLSGGYSFIKNNNFSYFPDFRESTMQFADLIFLNICDILTDITNDISFTKINGDNLLYAELNIFFNNQGQFILNLLFEKGYVVIGKTNLGFKILDTNEYTTNSKNQVLPKDKSIEVYVMKSDTYIAYEKSDKSMLLPFLEYLDNIFNSSNTSTARMGALVMATPLQPSQNPVPISLNDEDKKDLEEDFSESYGGLKTQKQIAIWKQAMNFTVINLSGLDTRTVEKAKLAITAICDRIKVPANQVAMIDATSSKSFANGTEMKEGDFAKYQSYERLLNKTFVKMFNDLSIKVDYQIYNKPTRKTQTAL